VRFSSILLFLVPLIGCTSYRPLFLSNASVQDRLRTPAAKILQIAVAQLRHPLLAPVPVNLRRGIGPDQAAVLAVILNPKLRADRDRRGLAAAQLIQAGILPNPSIGYTRDFVTGGNMAGTVSAYGFTGSWDISALVSHGAKVAAARANVQSISLDVAWTEWQTAVAAKLALYRVVALEAELIRARQIADDQQQTVDTLQAAVNRHEKSVLDLAAAQASREDSRATVLTLEQERDRQRLELKKAVGVLPKTELPIDQGVGLPSDLPLPSEGELVANLENRRLDLVGLRQGYQSQEQTVRAAVLAQFPKVGLGFSHGSDTTNVHTTGFGITIDLPVFDRNQGTSRSKRRLARNSSMNMPLVSSRRIPTSRRQSPTSDHSTTKLQRPKRLCLFFRIWSILPRRHRTKAQRTCLATSRRKPILTRRACKLLNSNSSLSTPESLWNLLREDIFRPAART
jgi:outer membrane protein TolC